MKVVVTNNGDGDYYSVDEISEIGLNSSYCYAGIYGHVYQGKPDIVAIVIN